MLYNNMYHTSFRCYPYSQEAFNSIYIFCNYNYTHLYVWQSKSIHTTIHTSSSISVIQDCFILFQRRHKNDDIVNRRKSLVLREGKVIEEEWQNVVVGDIIKMENNHFVAVCPAIS